MDRALPLRAVYLFGSHARGESHPDSDVDLCLVADGAERQLQAAQKCHWAIWDIRGKPSLTLVPITPRRLDEKIAIGDFFLERFLRKECCLPRKTDSKNPGGLAVDGTKRHGDDRAGAGAGNQLHRLPRQDGGNCVESRQGGTDPAWLAVGEDPRSQSAWRCAGGIWFTARNQGDSSLPRFRRCVFHRSLSRVRPGRS